jgi:hypothetical protein
VSAINKREFHVALRYSNKMRASQVFCEIGGTIAILVPAAEV